MVRYIPDSMVLWDIGLIKKVVFSFIEVKRSPMKKSSSLMFFLFFFKKPYLDLVISLGELLIEGAVTKIDTDMPSLPISSSSL